MSKKHDWNTWENYLRVHESVLKKYQNYFVTQNSKYKVDKYTDQYYFLSLYKLELKTNKGTNILINIEKDIEIDSTGRRAVARTIGYSYQAWTKGGDTLLRYCSPHETHNQFHHKHIKSNSPNNVIKILAESWPHVNEFFDELIDNF